MIYLVFVQADALHEVDLNLVAGGEAAHEVSAGQSAMLRDGEDRRNVVAGMGVIRREKRVVEIQFAYRDAIGPCRPFRRNTLALVEAEHG